MGEHYGQRYNEKFKKQTVKFIQESNEDARRSHGRAQYPER